MHYNPLSRIVQEITLNQFVVNPYLFLRSPHVRTFFYDLYANEYSNQVSINTALSYIRCIDNLMDYLIGQGILTGPKESVSASDFGTVDYPDLLEAIGELSFDKKRSLNQKSSRLQMPSTLSPKLRLSNCCCLLNKASLTLTGYKKAFQISAAAPCGKRQDCATMRFLRPF